MTQRAQSNAKGIIMESLRFEGYCKSTAHQYPICNILQVENPDSYACEIYNFQKTHSRMTVYCETRDPANRVPGFKLDFMLVSYWELFPTWDGINISIASPDKCAAILGQYKPVAIPISQRILEDNVLYSIQSSKRELKIIASGLTAYLINSKEDYLESLK